MKEKVQHLILERHSNNFMAVIYNYYPQATDRIGQLTSTEGLMASERIIQGNLPELMFLQYI